jgi:hypothetical protein
MAAAVEPSWRAVLAAALRQRGVTAAAPAVRAGDALWPLWTGALALGKEDAAGAQRALDELAAQHDRSRLDVEPELLRQFLLPPIVAGGTAQQLHAARTSMTEDAWREAWARLDTAGRIALLDLFQKHIGTTFVPANEAEAEAIWRFFQRSGDATGTAETMSASAAGIACLRRHLAADDGAGSRPLREAFAKQLGLDAQTLLPPPGDEWQWLVRRARIAGLAGEWTAPEQAQLAIIRAHRGVAPLAQR